MTLLSSEHLMSDFSRGLLLFYERFDCMADLLRSLQRQEVARTCNLNVLCRLHPWEDLIPSGVKADSFGVFSRAHV